VANFVCKHAVEAAHHLEVMGREQNLADAEPGYARLDEEIGRLAELLRTISRTKR